MIFFCYKTDPKKRTFNKTWSDWIHEIKKIPNHKFVNNGEDFSVKEDKECIKFIQGRFSKYKRNITPQNALIFAEIVGRDRNLLDTEISKFILTAPVEITEGFIIENAFPTTGTAVLYQFGNVLDTCSYSNSIIAMRKFLDMGINANVLADIMVKKSRWQLIAASLWEQGFSWAEVMKEMMRMGKFPSLIWHEKTQTPTEKRKLSAGLKELDDRIAYMTKIYGVKNWQMNPLKKKVRAEVMPMEFLAMLTTKFLREKIIAPYVNQYREGQMKALLVDRCLNTHLFTLDKLKEIRYGENPDQDLQEMIEALTSKVLIES